MEISLGPVEPVSGFPIIQPVILRRRDLLLPGDRHVLSARVPGRPDLARHARDPRRRAAVCRRCQR